VASLARHSWIVWHDLATLVTDDAIEPMGRRSPARMVEVDDALRATLGL